MGNTNARDKERQRSGEDSGPTMPSRHQAQDLMENGWSSSLRVGVSYFIHITYTCYANYIL